MSSRLPRPVLLSRRGRVMVERGRAFELVRRYTTSRRALEFFRAGWRVYVPAAGRGWRLADFEQLQAVDSGRASPCCVTSD
jgi:hypothetical protein